MAILFPKGSIGQSGGEYVAQVVFSETHSAISLNESSTGSTADLLLSASITPQHTDSKFAVFGMSSCKGEDGNANLNYEWSLKLYRDQSGNATYVGGNSTFSKAYQDNIMVSSMNGSENAQSCSFFYLDSPGSSNAITYQLRFVGGESDTYSINVGRDTSGPYNFLNAAGTQMMVMEFCTV
tara:strand:- start:265 stop:807 length:543 start_codon:yes stop_codon:yes gene_type:complete